METARLDEQDGERQRREVRVHLQVLAQVLSDLGPGAAAVGASAALLHRWQLVDVPRLPRVGLPRGHSHRHHPRADPVRCLLPDDELAPTGVEGLPATSAFRTLRDVARDLPVVDAVAVADSAARWDPTRLEEWRALAQRARGPSSGRLRRMLELADHRAESPLETLGRVPLVLAGLRIGLQVVLRPGGHRYDAEVEGSDVLLEWDGRVHLLGWQRARDLEHMVEAVDGGKIVVRTRWRQVRHQTRDYVAFVQRTAERHRTPRHRRAA